MTEAVAQPDADLFQLAVACEAMGIPADTRFGIPADVAQVIQKSPLLTDIEIQELMSIADYQQERTAGAGEYDEARHVVWGITGYHR